MSVPHLGRVEGWEESMDVRTASVAASVASSVASSRAAPREAAGSRSGAGASLTVVVLGGASERAGQDDGAGGAAHRVRDDLDRGLEQLSDAVLGLGAAGAHLVLSDAYGLLQDQQQG